MTAPTAVDRAVESLRRGDSLVICDDQVCALAAPAELIDVAEVNRFAHLGGVLSAAVAAERLDQLGIEPMIRGTTGATAATVSVDAANGGTGISALDRTETLRALCFDTTGEGLVSPGHVFPVRVAENEGAPRGIPGACVVLARIAQLAPVVAYCEILDRQGRAVGPSDLTGVPGLADHQVISVRELQAELRGLTVGGPCDRDRFRETMARLVSGVAAVTVRDGSGSPRGMLVTSVTPYSDRPPSVLVCIGHGSRTHDPVLEATGLGVHLLDARQDDVARVLAGKGEQKFDHLDWEWDGDVPRIKGAADYLRCVRTASFVHGDHSIVIGDIEIAEAGGSSPLVYFQRSFDWVLEPTPMRG